MIICRIQTPVTSDIASRSIIMSHKLYIWFTDYLHKSQTMNMCRKQIQVTSDSVLMLPRLYLRHVPALQEKVGV